MKRRTLIEGAASAALLAFMPAAGVAKSAAVPWEKLRRSVDGRLVAVRSPLRGCTTAAACDALFADLKNPYFVRDNPALTQTLGWADAWTSEPSWYAVRARSANDIAAAVTFAKEHGLRLAVRGGGHSYLGTSNAPDSLLAWTRDMNEIELTGDSVTMGTGNIWAQAYDAVTTKGGRYVQGGGCCTVNVGGLISSGGFGSFSKRYGTAAGSLLAAEIVTADGTIRRVDATHDADLFWALKGGGGGSFGVMTSVTLKLHDLTPYHGAVIATIEAHSDDAYRELIERFMTFYRESLFNEHWGESVAFSRKNVLEITMVASGLSNGEMTALWKPFFDSIQASPSKFHLKDAPVIVAIPAQRWWDGAFWQQRAPFAIKLDPRPGRGSEWWWAGDSDQVGWFIYNYESLWMPATLLDDAHMKELSDAIFAATRHFTFAFHFNKGLAGAPDDAIARARDTAMNPAVLGSFALAICADGEQGIYPGVAGRQPDMIAARAAARGISACVNTLRSVAPDGGAYVSESSYFESDYGHAYWGANYSRLQTVKKRYDPENFFRVRNGVIA